LVGEGEDVAEWFGEGKGLANYVARAERMECCVSRGDFSGERVCQTTGEKGEKGEESHGEVHDEAVFDRRISRNLLKKRLIQSEGSLPVIEMWLLKLKRGFFESWSMWVEVLKVVQMRIGPASLALIEARMNIPQRILK
jgi:hypothetical protein